MLKVGEGSTHVKELVVSLVQGEKETCALSLFSSFSHISHTFIYLSINHTQPLNPEDYVAVGLAMCYKINDGGKLDGM